MTRVTFRAYRIGEHERVTQQALDGMVGQHFFVTEGPELSVDEKPLEPDDDGLIHVRTTQAMYLSKVLAARVEDGWIVVEADLIPPSENRRGWVEELSLGFNNLYTLPPEPPSVRWTVTPRPPDWSSVEGELAPSRAKNVVDQIAARNSYYWQAAAQDEFVNYAKLFREVLDEADWKPFARTEGREDHDSPVTD